MLHHIARSLVSLQDSAVGRSIKRAAQRATNAHCARRIRRWTTESLPRCLNQPMQRTLTAVDGHRLDIDQIDRDSVIYSCGIGQSIDFEFDLNRRFGCDIELFDPAPRSIAYIASQPAIQGLHFNPTGIWNADRPTRFYFDTDLACPDSAEHASACNHYAKPGFFEAEAKTLKSLMQDRGHSHIDLLKLDIEGGTAQVLDRAFDDGIYPRQITAQLDAPAHRSAINAFFEQVLRLCERLKDSGYELWMQPCPSETEGKIELLAIRPEPQPANRAAVAGRESVAAEPSELALACD